MTTSRVLFLTSTFPRWQGDRIPAFVYTLSQYMAKDYEVHVVAPWYPGAKRHETMEGVHVHRFKYSVAGFNLAYGGGIASNLKQNPFKLMLIPLFVLSQLVCALRLLRSRQFLLIHAHWVVPQALVAWLACWFMGWDSRQRTICTCHGSDVLALGGSVMTRLKNFLYQRMGWLTVVSNGLRDAVISTCGSGIDVKVVPMGTDFDNTFYPCPGVYRDWKASVFVGRLVEQKGVLVLLKSFCLVAAKDKDASLHVVGDGPLLHQAREIVSENGLTDRVTFHGFCNPDRVADIFRCCGIAVFPSIRMEGFGLSTVEAMGCECVVMASDFPSAHELITDGDTGVLFPANDMHTLAQKWSYVLENSDRLAVIGRRARARVKAQYGWERCASQMKQLYCDFQQPQ